MKAFLWHQIEKVSDAYHEGGSVLIEALNVHEARQMAIERGMLGVGKDPDLILDSESTENKIWIFPDAGCC